MKRARSRGKKALAMTRSATAGTSGGLAATVDRVIRGKERVVLRRGGKQVAALVPIEDLRVLEELESRVDLDEARRILHDRRTKWAPWAQVKKRLGP